MDSPESSDAGAVNIRSHRECRLVWKRVLKQLDWFDLRYCDVHGSCSVLNSVLLPGQKLLESFDRPATDWRSAEPAGFRFLPPWLSPSAHYVHENLLVQSSEDELSTEPD